MQFCSYSRELEDIYLHSPVIVSKSDFHAREIPFLSGNLQGSTDLRSPNTAKTGLPLAGFPGFHS